MAIFAATDYDITIGGTNYSAKMQSIELPVSVNSLDTTNFDSNGWTETIGGLKSGTINLNFMTDFANSGIDDALWALLGTVTAIVVKPTSASVGSSNPSFSFSALVSDLKPIGATVGDLAVQQVSWPVSGAITRAEA